MTDTPPGGCSHAVCLPLAGDACRFDSASTAPDTNAILTARWATEPNPDLGDTRIVAHTPGGPVGVADLTYNRRVAEHIADLHNRHLAGDDGKRPRGLLSAPTSAEHGAVAPEATPNPASDVQPRGCPEPQWDGPYQFRCGMGAEVGVCAIHGRFRDREPF